MEYQKGKIAWRLTLFCPPSTFFLLLFRNLFLLGERHFAQIFPSLLLDCCLHLLSSFDHLRICLLINLPKGRLSKKNNKIWSLRSKFCVFSFWQNVKMKCLYYLKFVFVIHISKVSYLKTSSKRCVQYCDWLSSELVEDRQNEYVKKDVWFLH